MQFCHNVKIFLTLQNYSLNSSPPLSISFCPLSMLKEVPSGDIFLQCRFHGCFEYDEGGSLCQDACSTLGMQPCHLLFCSTDHNTFCAVIYPRRSSCTCRTKSRGGGGEWAHFCSRILDMTSTEMHNNIITLHNYKNPFHVLFMSHLLLMRLQWRGHDHLFAFAFAICCHCRTLLRLLLLRLINFSFGFSRSRCL